MNTFLSMFHRSARIGPRKAAGVAGVCVWIVGASAAGLSLPVVGTVAGLAIVMLAAAFGFMEWRRHGRPAPVPSGRVYGTRVSHPLGEVGDATVSSDWHCSFVAQNRLERQLAAANEQLIRVERSLDDEAAWRDVVLAIRAEGEPPQVTPVWAFPRVVTNSYQSLLYQEFPDSGLSVRYPSSLDALDAIPYGSIVNLHWTRFVQANAESVREARQRSDDVLRRVDAVRKRGAFLVWSVHERLPHDCRFPEVEMRFRQQLADAADVIHVLHDATAGVVEDAYHLAAEKCVTVPHPLYFGVTPDHVSREAARSAFGLGDSDVMILCFGAIRPYKGYERVIDVLPHIRDQFPDRRIRVVIAGVSLHTDPIVRGYISMLQRRASATSGVTVVPRAIAERNVHVLFNAADTTVYPYRTGLNSGALFLSLTFGVPAVIHRNPVTAGLEAVGPVHAVDCDLPDVLASAIIESLKWDRSTIRLDDAFVREHLPVAVSRRMATTMLERTHR